MKPQSEQIQRAKIEIYTVQRDENGQIFNEIRSEIAASTLLNDERVY